MKKINVNNFLFFLGYALILFSDMFSSVNKITNYVNYIDYIGLAILSFLIFLRLKDERIVLKKIIILFFLCFALFLIKIYSGDNLLIKLFIIILAFREIEINHFVKIDMMIRLVYLLIVVALFKAGLTSNYYIYREDGSIRSSMGFSHPNNFGQYILVLCCDYIFLKFNKLKLIDYIIPIGGAIIIDIFSNSRTSIFCMLLLILLTLIYRFMPKIFENKMIKKTIINIFLVFTIIAGLSVYLYNSGNPLFTKINDTLSNRLSYASRFLEEYNINLFGNEITMLYTQEARRAGLKPWVLDNSYLVCILRYGLVGYILIYFLTRSGLKKIYETKRYEIIIMWIIFSLNGIFENYLFKIHFNPYLIILSYLLYDNIINKDKCKESDKHETINPEKKLYI